MSDVSGTLIGLIDVAERTLCLRQRIAPSALDDFAREVAALQPPIGVVLSQAPRHLVAVLGCCWESPEPQRPLWLMTVAALLQLVRADLSQVIEARRQPLDPDFEGPAMSEQNEAVPVDQWRIIVDEPVLIYVVHANAKYESDPKRRREEWEAWCVGRWISHNKGGWIWYGLCGQVTHVAPLPERPR